MFTSNLIRSTRGLIQPRLTNPILSTQVKRSIATVDPPDLTNNNLYPQLHKGLNLCSQTIRHLTLRYMKPLPPKLIVGDWAGTFIDKFSLAPIEALRALLEEHGIVLPVHIIRVGMGLPKRDHLKILMSHPEFIQQWTKSYGASPQDSDLDILYKQFVPYQLKILSNFQNVEPLPKTIKTLRHLKSEYDLKIGLTTGYDQVMSDRVLETLRQNQSPLLDLIDCVIPAPSSDPLIRKSNKIRGRPYPDGIYEIMNRYQIENPKQVWKLDDTPAGIDEGRNAGVITVGLTDYGNEFGKHLEHPKMDQGIAKMGLRPWIDHTLNSASEDCQIATCEARQASRKSLGHADYVISTINQLPCTIDEHLISY